MSVGPWTLESVNVVSPVEGRIDVHVTAHRRVAESVQRVKLDGWDVSIELADRLTTLFYTRTDVHVETDRHPEQRARSGGRPRTFQLFDPENGRRLL